MQTEFVHLHVHSEYSIKDGIVRIEELTEAIPNMGMWAVAITDISNLFATVKFYQAALSNRVKPIIGSELLVKNPADLAKPFRIVCLCQNAQGYRNLIYLVSKAYTYGQDNGSPLVEKTWILENNEGLIILSGAKEGDVGQALLSNNMEQAQQLAQAWQASFPDRYFIELQRTDHRDDENYNRAAVELAQVCDLAVVATNNVRFLTAEDFDAHEARVCIQEGYTLDDPKRPKLYTAQQYVKSPQQMAELFADIPSAITNSVMIAKRCNFELTLGKTFLPNYPVPVGLTAEEYFAREAKQGLAQRLALLFDNNAADFNEKRKIYDERLQQELQVINAMGFAGYFLIVADFIKWAINNGVPVGPGRGSGAGSLVAYSLGITGLDPLRYDLLFERFLNPERVSMPDFDVDFCMEGRDRVIEYVANTYGRESVAQIITYGSMAAKAVVRDVGRVLGQPYGFVDKIAKLIPFEIGMTLDKALAQEEELRERYNTEDDVSTLIDLAKKLEGIIRNAGKHAGGVVIAPSLLTDFVPLYCESGSESLVTQFDKDDVESVGLVKFDFLGLRTLTIIDWAVRSIKDKLDINLIPLDDQATYQLLKDCATTAVFQLESRGMKDLIKRLQPDCFEDIIALVALFRPGPLQSGMVDDFIDRKHGRALVEYPHPNLAPILRPTYGVILYQEQVMQIAQVLAGYSLGEADLLRRAMGKKKPEEMAKQRQIFTKGAIARGVDAGLAQSIFDLMEKFAGYGFNKSHSAAYALLAYQTAWLKAHYPAEFMAAVLSSDMDNTDKVVTLIDECQRMKITIIPPNVNCSQFKFTACDEKKIIYGLGALKGVGEAAIESVTHNRQQQGEFRDLFDFCHRIDLRKVNRRVLDAMIKAGAFDCFNVSRATMMASVDKALQSAEQTARNNATGQNDLFGLLAETSEQHYVEVKDWPDTIRLQGEKETLGLYLTGHPIAQYQAELSQFITGRIADLAPRRDQTIIVAGFIVALRTMQTKRGDRMAFVTLDDRSARIELAIFSDGYEEYRRLLQKDQLVIVEGEVSVDEYSGGYRMSAKRLFDMESARLTFGKHLILRLNHTIVKPELLKHLQTMLHAFNGQGFPVAIEYNRDDCKAVLPFAQLWRVKPSDELLGQLYDLIGREAVIVKY